MSDRGVRALTLGDVATLEYGAALPATTRSGDKFPVFGSNGEVGRHNTSLVKGPGIIVGRKGSVGELMWSSTDFWPIDTTYYVETKPGVDKRWLYWSMSALGLQHLDSSTGVPGLNRNDAYELPLQVPSLTEQHRVAGILDALAWQAAATDRTASKLEALKQALYQELFDRSEVRTEIGAVAEVRNGSTPSRARRDYWERGSVAWLASGKVNDYRVTMPSELVTPRAVSECHLRILPPGSVLVGMIGQGKTRGMAARLDISAAINQNLAGIVPGPRLLGAYLHHYLVYSYPKLRSGGRGSNQDALTSGLVAQFQVPVPPVEEQRRVADLLDALDLRIESEREVVAKLVAEKEGLLADLLNGRVRVSVEAAS